MSDVPDGRPSDLYEIKGPGFKAQALVDTSSGEVYCTMKPVLAMRGWNTEKMRSWMKGKEQWALNYVGPGSAIKALKFV